MELIFPHNPANDVEITGINVYYDIFRKATKPLACLNIQL